MQERLVIRNFGPIKSVDLNLGRMTILIGEQATGKSTIAKVLSMCRYFSYIVSPNENYSGQNFYKGLFDWDLENCLNHETLIIYENDDYKFEFNHFFNKIDKEIESFRISSKIIPKSTLFLELQNDYKMLYQEVEKEFEDFVDFWEPNENFYRLNVKKVMDNPLFLPVERILQAISFNKDLLISEAIQDELRKLNRITRAYIKEVDIQPLSLKFKNENGFSYVKKQNDSKFHLLHNGASGYQSTIPIVLAIRYYTEIEKRNRTFIIEEPEMNLFPKAQKKLVEFFIESMNNFNHQFLLPTHSPYILSSLNNLMYAYKVANEFNAKEEVQQIINENYWVNPNNVEVYFLENGEARSLIDKEEGLINIDFLDGVSETINEAFDKLLAIEISKTKDSDND